MENKYLNYSVLVLFIALLSCASDDAPGFVEVSTLTIDGRVESFQGVTALNASNGVFFITLSNGFSANDPNYESVSFRITDPSERSYIFTSNNQEYSDTLDDKFFLYTNNQVSPIYSFITAQYDRTASIQSVLTITVYNEEAGLVEGNFSGHLFTSLNDDDPSDGISASHDVVITNGSFKAKID